MTFNKSLYFEDLYHKKYFLFQVLNYGKTSDELKFIFNTAKEGTGITYLPYGLSEPSKEDIIKPYGEISYHQDGLVIWKYPKYKDGDTHNYINPKGNGMKCIPLKQIREWIPFVKCTIVDYQLCRKSKNTESLLLPFNKNIFNGDPFEYIIWLGNMVYANPPNNEPTEMIYRINDVAHNIDLIVWMYKSDYKGQIITIPNTEIKIFNTSNIIQMVEKTTTDTQTV